MTRREEEEQDFNVFAGAETGILKGINVNRKTCISKNFHNIKSLQKEQEITCMSFGEDENEILMGLRNQTVKIYDVKFRSFAQSVETKGGSGPLVGVARYDETLLTASESGVVKLWRYPTPTEFNPIDVDVEQMGKLKRKDKTHILTEEARTKHAESLKVGRRLCRLRQCKLEPSIVATAGLEADLQIWDLGHLAAGPLFRAKNVKPDFLELRVPVWVADMAFLSHKTVATVSRHGHIRLYDFREAQRRPRTELVWEEKGDPQTGTCITAKEDNQVVVGTSTGKLGLWDFRKGAGFKGLIRKYKGCVGGVRDISSVPGSGYFAVVGLDRYLRVYNIKDKKPEFNTYLKSRLNTVLMTSNFSPDGDVKSNSSRSFCQEAEAGAYSDRLNSGLQEEDSAQAANDDSDIEIIDMNEEEDDKKSASLIESVEKAGEEEEKFWESLPVIDSRPVKKKKKKTRQLI